jgi:hypothetical protein
MGRGDDHTDRRLYELSELLQMLLIKLDAVEVKLAGIEEKLPGLTEAFRDYVEICNMKRD